MFLPVVLLTVHPFLRGSCLIIIYIGYNLLHFSSIFVKLYIYNIIRKFDCSKGHFVGSKVSQFDGQRGRYDGIWAISTASVVSHIFGQMKHEREKEVKQQRKHDIIIYKTTGLQY